MSYVDGQLADFRGGRMGGPPERARVVSGAAGQKVRYQLATGALTPAAAIVLTLVGATPDPIGVLSGGGTIWTPNDAGSRYLVELHMQTTTGNAVTLAGGIYTNTGVTPVCVGQSGTTGAQHLCLTADNIDFSTALNLEVIGLVAAGVLGDSTTIGNQYVNHIDIVRLSVQ